MLKAGTDTNTNTFQRETGYFPFLFPHYVHYVGGNTVEKNVPQQPWTQRSLLSLLPASPPLLLCTNQFLPGALSVVTDWILSFPPPGIELKDAFLGEPCYSSKSFFHTNSSWYWGRTSLVRRLFQYWFSVRVAGNSEPQVVRTDHPNTNILRKVSAKNV